MDGVRETAGELDHQEEVIMSFYYDQDSPSGVGFETIDVLTQYEDTLCQAMELASRISNTLPDEAKAIMAKEGIPLYRIFTDKEGFWGEWCNSEKMDVDNQMNKLLDKIAVDLKNATN